MIMTCVCGPEAVKPDLLFQTLIRSFGSLPLWVKGVRIWPELRVTVDLPDGNHQGEVLGDEQVSKLQEKKNIKIR